MIFFSLVFGTRPEYLKMKPLIDLFYKEKDIEFQVIYIQQHTSIDISFEFDIIRLPVLELSENRLEDLASQILRGLPSLLSKTTHLVVEGDTATVFYSALVAFQKNIKVVHIEAGLRTYTIDKPFPEEGYRQMVSRITSYHFTPHRDSEELLIQEKVNGKIYTVGNTILDLIKSYNLTTQKGNTVLITLHRRENWTHMISYIKQINQLVDKYPHLTFIWFLHPNESLQKIVRDTIHHRVVLKNPMSHKPFSEEISKCYLILTDSGGIQEEASFLGKQCIVLRTTTERSHIPYPYIQMIQHIEDIDTIFLKVTGELLPPCSVYGKGDSASKIYTILKSQIEEHKLLLSSNA